MFFCGFCKKTSESGQPKVMIVTKTRPREYLPRPWANDLGGTGLEVAEETAACPKCATENAPATPAFSNRPRVKARKQVDEQVDENRDL